MKPVISIVIPTKGRVECVNALAADLTSSAGYSNNKVCISVLDNATPGASYALPKDVKLIVRREEVSAAENILSAATICHGFYSWIIGDDDAFPDDIFCRVFELVNTHEPGLIRLLHEYAETDEIIRSFKFEPSSNKEQESFCWTCYGLNGVKDFELKSGFISAHIIRSDILNEALRLTRATTNISTYSSNIYITKLYTVLSFYLSGGFWVSHDTLVKQRVPVSGRYFVESSSEWFKNFVASPAEVYKACTRFNKSLGNILLSIHFSKKIDYRLLARDSVSILRPLQYIHANFKYMGIKRGLVNYLECIRAYIRASLRFG